MASTPNRPNEIFVRPVKNGLVVDNRIFGYSGFSGAKGSSGYSGLGLSGYSGAKGSSGYS